MSLTGAGDNQVKTYSGGMRRRFDLAASLIGRPPVLFLDEPTTGLDPRTRNDLWQFIGDLVAEGTTVLLTTQYMEEAEHLAQAIVVLDAGRIAAQGTADELKDQLGGNVLEVQVTKRTDLEKAASLIAGLASAPPRLDAALNRVKQYEQGALFRFGRLRGSRNPGLRLIIPFVDVLHRVSLRIVTMPIQSQGIITRDNVSVDVSAVAYFPRHGQAGRSRAGEARQDHQRRGRSAGRRRAGRGVGHDDGSPARPAAAEPAEPGRDRCGQEHHRGVPPPLMTTISELGSFIAGEKAAASHAHPAAGTTPVPVPEPGTATRAA